MGRKPSSPRNVSATPIAIRLLRDSGMWISRPKTEIFRPGALPDSAFRSVIVDFFAPCLCKNIPRTRHLPQGLQHSYEGSHHIFEVAVHYSAKNPESRFAKPRLVCYSQPRSDEPLFPGSSVVEQPAVNRLVAGSNPARGATISCRSISDISDHPALHC